MRRRRRFGWALGCCLGAGVLVASAWPGAQALRRPGPMNVGHEHLECASCHRPAPGTTRQQLQANVRTSLGLRATWVDFGLRPVGNADCRSCHDRPDDRHPVHRFLEPRFADARAALSPQNCTSCHGEHTGRRATVEPDACRHCHGDLEIAADPVVPTHAALVAAAEWPSCLGCHDFHGNHDASVPTTLEAAIPPEWIERYLAGGADPYPGPVRHRARTDNGAAKVEDGRW